MRYPFIFFLAYSILQMNCALGGSIGSKSIPVSGEASSPMSPPQSPSWSLQSPSDSANNSDIDELQGNIFPGANPGSILDQSDYFSVAELAQILEEDSFIPFSVNPMWADSTESMSHIGLTQEAFVYVLHHNPSHFKEERFCPNTPEKPNRHIELNGVEMCRDYPVEQVTAVNEGYQESNEEFLDSLNQIYAAAGLSTRYRQASMEEWNWFFSQSEQDLSSARVSDLWRYTTFFGLSHLDPTQDPALNIPSYSGERQTHSVKAKQPIATFQLPTGKQASFWLSGGVFEWTSTPIGNKTAVVGYNWSSIPYGYQTSGWPGKFRVPFIGASRLVRTTVAAN